MIIRIRNFVVLFAVLLGAVGLLTDTGLPQTKSLVDYAASQHLHANRAEMNKQSEELKRLVAGLDAVQGFFVDAFIEDGRGPENHMLHMQIEIGEEFMVAAARGDIAELRAFWRDMTSEVRSLEREERKIVEDLIRGSGAYSIYVDPIQLRKKAKRIVGDNRTVSEADLQTVEDYWNFLKDTGLENSEDEGQLEEFLGRHRR